jgi:hypothetical protein
MPTKAFEENPSLEFDHFLAQKLGMLVADMRMRMSGEEYTDWYVYYRRQAQRRELAAQERSGG